MKKRMLSILLTLCMVLALLPLSALAESAGTNNVYGGGADTGITPAPGRDDHTPPEVTGVYMNSPGATVTVGDKLEFSVSTEDASGIYMTSSRLYFTYVCEQDHQHTVTARAARGESGSYDDAYDEETKQAKFELTISDGMLNGTYKLSKVWIYDTYNNYADFYPANPGNIDFDSVNFTVTGSSAAEDHDPPTVSSVSMEEPGKAVTVGDKLEFSVSAEDVSGIYMTSSRLYFTYVCEQDHQHTVTARAARGESGSYDDAYDEETKQAKFELTISDGMLNGTYKLSKVWIYDTYNNYADFYPANPGNIDFDAVCFTVTGASTTDDHDPPTVSSVSMEEPGKAVTVGDKLEFSVSAEDASGIYMTSSRLYFTYVCEQDHQHTVTARAARGESGSYDDAYDEETKQAKFELTISDGMLNGTYKLSKVWIYDTYNNYADFYPANPGNIDFDSIYFTIAIPDILPEAVSIPEAISLPVRSTQTIRPTVTPVDSLPKWTWVSADTNVAEVVISENNKSCTITGVTPGTTAITGTTQNGLTATCTVTVTDAPMPESGTVEESYQVGVGGYVDILPVLIPADATTLYEITSDNPHVASAVTTGGQTGVRIQGNVPGKAAITIRGVNNLIMTTTVTVGRPEDTQHEKVIYPGYAATCTRPGRTDAVKCSACRYVFTESEEIPATGEHTYGDWRVVREATATTDGLKERRCLTCGNRETESIPATGDSNSPDETTTPGETTNPGSSGSPNTGDYDRTPPAAPSQNISAGEQELSVTVSNGAVNVSATDKQIKNAIADSKETGIVEIDITAVANASEVKIPQKMVSAIQDSEDVSGFSVTTKSGSIEISAAALNTVSNALTGSGDQLSLKIDTVDVNAIPSAQKYPIANVLNTAVFVELSAAVIHQNGSRDPIHEFNGDVTVSIPYDQPANMAGRQVIACHIADNGAITYFPVRYENGIVTFTTTHFSTFGIVESYASAFSDIDVSAWYMLSVEYILGNSLMNGYGSDLFAPDANLSRAQLAQILYNKEGKPVVSGGSAFTDVAGGAWYADAVTWAAAKNIVGGYGNGRFGPDDNITREQLAVMLWRYAGEPGTNGGLAFRDAGQTSSYALTAMCWAVEKGIINGKGDGILDPKGLATRAQVAQMLKNYLDN